VPHRTSASYPFFPCRPPGIAAFVLSRRGRGETRRSWRGGREGKSRGRRGETRRNWRGGREGKSRGRRC
jgi:hypothetical protein